MYVSGIGHISVSFYRNARKKLLPNSEKVSQTLYQWLFGSTVRHVDNLILK